MSDIEKLDISLIEFIDNVSTNLKREIDHTHRVIRKHLENENKKGDNINYCSIIDCPIRLVFRQTLYKTIKDLEVTKRSFKSKELENLRKNLEEVLLEVK